MLSRLSYRPRHQAIAAQTLSSLGRAAEYLFVLFSLLAFTGSITALVRFGSTSPPDADGLTIGQTVLLPVYLITLGMLLTKPGTILDALWRNLPAVLLLCMAVISASWSEAPAYSLRMSGTLAATSMFGLYLGTRFHPRRVLQLLACTLGIVALASLVFGLLLPERGVDTELHEGAWRGIYGHKQLLGLHMALGTVVFVLLGRTSSSGWYVWPGAVLCGALLLLSKSSTSLLVALSVLLALRLLLLLRRGSLLSVALGIVGLAMAGTAVALVAFQANEALGILGKEASLTGRVPLWHYVLNRIGDQPWLGYGYQGFWLGWSGPSADVSQATGYWYPFHAHNGYLEVLLDLGIVGLAIFLSAWATGLVRTLKALKGQSRSEDQWQAAFLIFLILIGAGETVLLRHNTLFTVLFAAILFAPTPNESVSTGKDTRPPLASGLRWASRHRSVPRRLQVKDPATSPVAEEAGETFRKS